MAYKVLIVDDSKLARMAVARALNNLHPDWIRIEATNADEALALAKQSAVDIALVDFNMPGRDGLSLAAEIRDLDPNVAVALISANVQQEIVDRAGQIGATFLAKPLTEAAIGAFLSDVAARLRAASQ
jgi:YesN/AraC family two-component response regulator